MSAIFLPQYRIEGDGTPNGSKVFTRQDEAGEWFEITNIVRRLTIEVGTPHLMITSYGILIQEDKS